MHWQVGINRALAYIEDNLDGTVEIAAAAKQAGCSTGEFQRLFSLLTEAPVGEYIRRRRLSLAAQALQNSREKVIDIALRHGYDSPAAFSRAFRQEFGVSPSEAQGGPPLPVYPRITAEYIVKEWLSKMSKFIERGYVVRENGPVYFTPDMARTLEWFERVLGWYGDIAGRDADGKPEYGCVFDYPDEVAVTHLTPFRGFHLFRGEAVSGVVGFLMVDNLDALHRYVTAQGWEQISGIEEAPWGARECRVTTVDGCVLRFFETTGS